MNEKEKQTFDIANCKCCMLADMMKSCPVCQFNIGLAEKSERIPFEQHTLPIPITLFSEQQQLT